MGSALGKECDGKYRMESMWKIVMESLWWTACDRKYVMGMKWEVSGLKYAKGSL